MRILLVISILIGIPFLTLSQDKVELKMGDVVPDINVNDIHDQPFTLTSLRGKIVLLDFWATWCQPCIQEQPELLELYTEVKEAGKSEQFEILGVSLDMKREDWERGVEKFGIVWPQVSDLKFWRSEVAADYNLQELPYNLVIDEEGRIIAINLHGEELTEFIKRKLEL